MVKFKEFVLKCNYYNNDTIDDMINDYVEKRDTEIIDVRYTSAVLDGTSEMYVRALLIYKEFEIITV